MNDNCYCHIDQKFKEDLAIFSFEMITFVLTKYIKHFNFVANWITSEDSEFTEEVGNAVMATLDTFSESYSIIILNDFPKYLSTLENFERYFMERAKEIQNACEPPYFVEQLLRVTAFFVELIVYVFGKGEFHNNYIIWWKMFLNVFYDRFRHSDGWSELHKECLKKSKGYKKSDGVAVLVGFPGDSDPRACILFAPKYHVIDPVTERKMLPKDTPTRPRQKVLDRNFAFVTECRSNHCSVKPVKVDIENACIYYCYVKLRKRKLSMEVNRFRSMRLESNRSSMKKKKPKKDHGTDTKTFDQECLLNNQEFAQNVTGDVMEIISKVEEDYQKFKIKLANKEGTKVENRNLLHTD